MKSNIRKKRNMRMRPLCALLGILLVIGAASGVVYAKYVQQQSDRGVVRAKWFYFTSDLLKDSSENKKYHYQKGTSEITFTLRNGEDDLRESEVAINYTITVAKRDGNEWKDVSNYQKKGKIAEGGKEEITIDVKKNLGEKDGLDGKYKITAMAYCKSEDGSTKGYEKVLTAVINTEDTEIDQKLCYYVDANADKYNDPYVVLLTVYAENYTGNVKITYPEDLIPDNTDERMAEATTESGPITDSETFIGNGYSSHTYRFFMSDTGALIGQNDFKVVGDDITAIYKNPNETE